GEIVRYHGYPYEEHEVLTEDGYYLTVQRIPHGRDNTGSVRTSHKAEAQESSMFCPPPKPAVLLQHGLVLEGSSWLTNLPNNSLGFILADANYDVWIGNSRGNSWSRKHKEFEFHHQEYSAYSFHEMAMYDLPATINYILRETGQEQLYYVAHSQGTTTGFIAFSSIPELDHKIKMFFAFAPVATVQNVKSPLIRLLHLPEGLIKLILGRTIVFDKGEVLQQVASRLCSYSIFKSLCSLLLSLPGGFSDSLNVSRIDAYLSRYPDSTSLKNILHWRQIYRTGEFKCYDYGSDNMLHYNQTTPPVYKLENMKAPFAVWYSGRDWLSSVEDVNYMLLRITNTVYKKYIPEFTHFDYIWSSQAYEQVYKEILELMEKST
ncbi:LIPM Lipase, partial [Ceuthmochares aereus]|nr:LIPM Lipase [Ceuthmochares aereus]